MTKDVERLIQAVRDASVVVSEASYLADQLKRQAETAEWQARDAKDTLKDAQRALNHALSDGVPYIYDFATDTWIVKGSEMSVSRP